MWLGPSPLPLWAWQKLVSLVRGRREGSHRHLGVSWKPHTKARPLMLISSFFHWRFLSTSLSETLYGFPKVAGQWALQQPSLPGGSRNKGTHFRPCLQSPPTATYFSQGQRQSGPAISQLVSSSTQPLSPVHCCQLSAPPSLWLLPRIPPPPPGLSPGSQHQLRWCF